MSETTKKKQTGATNAAQVGKTNQAIIDFIRNCSPFEADAFRIMVGVADGKAKIESLEASEADILNSYLNHGCFKDGTDERKLEKHRRERARILMTKVETYVKGGSLADANDALYDFASDESYAKQGLLNLLSKPKEASTNGQSLFDAPHQ